MDMAEQRKERLENLLHLARIARGMSRAQLARSLGRDPTKLLPESGNPKLDYVVALAEVLEWPVGDVVEAVWHGGANPASTPAPGATFDSIREQIAEAVQKAQYHRVVSLSKQMFEVAKTNDERAHALIREAAGWDGLGRYARTLECARNGLQLGPISLRLRLVMQATLANAQYTLWDLTPALGTAEVLARWYEQNPPTKSFDWKRVAYVHYIRGHTHRRLMAMEPENRNWHLARAAEDLGKAIELYEKLAVELDDDSLRGIANTCRMGLIEIDVEAGRRDAAEATDFILAKLGEIAPKLATMPGDWIESYGWASIFGSEIAARDLQGRDRQHKMVAFMNHALVVADRLDNWSMRERVFTMQFGMHLSAVEATGLDLDYTIDERERSMITATMGRFPCFRSTGWKILETAKVVAGRS
ncbi:MAG TPA: hypothetical protein VG797_06050 [Phycisphaerales bacterium]|nr:hypothetical protein [Phycisphaerales bacterium]